MCMTHALETEDIQKGYTEDTLIIGLSAVDEPFKRTSKGW